MTRFVAPPAMVFLVAAILSACGDGGFTARILGRHAAPDELPVMQNRVAPFRYPAALYAQRIQGNVSLKLFIDEEGRVQGDSTRVVESSGNIALDSAALVGTRELAFTPARRNGRAVAVTIIYPVFFRHPDAPPLPGDTVLRQRYSRRDST